MRSRPLICICFLACLISPAFAQVEQPTAIPSRPEEKVIPSFEANDNTIDEVVAMLRKDDPNVQIVLVHSSPLPGTGVKRSTEGSPRLRLLLKNVTTADVLNVVSRAYPNIALDGIGGATQEMIYILRVRDTSAGSDTRQVVQVYNLAPMVKAWQQLNDAKPGDDQNALKKALDDILSLIQAALAQTHEPTEAVIQVHPPTQTLIFRGTPAQQAAVEQAVNALRPPRADSGSAEAQIAQLKAKVDAQAEELARLRDKAAPSGDSGSKSSGKP
jgi:hypothetical protein